MSRKIFTEEQQQLLRQNPYIYSVTDTRINLTKEFKEIFLKEYKSGISPRKILEDHGFDIDTIGERRVWSISNYIRIEFKKYCNFHEGFRSRAVPTSDTFSNSDSKSSSDADKIKQLQQEVDYLKQEMEFLKNFLNQNYKEVGALLMNDSSCIFEIIYNTMQQSHNTMSIKTLCAMAGVSRSGYYAWLNAAPARAQREQQDRDDFEQILTAYKMHGYSKGAKGIYMALLHMDPPVVMNLKKIRRLMDKFNLSCPYRGPNPYRRMAKALKTSSVADNLLQREFEAYGPRIVLLTDITYLPYNGTFAYLSTVLDAFTKQILSYVLSPSLEVDFVLETINKLVEYHGVSLQAETIIHSDQGCHYTSHKFINILYDKKLRQSMSRKGNCWDNAPQESFFGHMKDHIKPELAECTSFADVQVIIDNYIDYYNNRRYQWHLARLSPNEFYKFVTTGKYPLDIPNIPAMPAIKKDPKELGASAVDIDDNK